MVDFNVIAECLKSVVSWKNTLSTDEGQLDARFPDPTSGMYYNLNSEIINLTKMGALGRISDTLNYPRYSVTTTYEAGDIVEFANDLYKALGTVTGEEPDQSANFQKLEPFSNWLEDWTNTVCFRLANAISTRKKLDRQAKSLLSDAPLYNNYANLRNTSNYIPNNGRFVGLKLSAKQYRDINLNIHRLVLQFTEAQTNLDIYVFHSSQLEPLQVIPVSTTKAKSAEIVQATIKLNYNSDEYTQGGCFYIGYYQEDIAGQAIKDKNFKFKAPCTCNRGAYKRWSDFNKFVSVSSFYLQDGDFIKGELWDLDKEKSDCSTYGLNIRLSAECSINGFICENKNIFAQALITQAELYFAETVLNTDRTNELDERLLNQASINLSEEAFDLKKRLEDQIDVMNFDISDLDTPCAPKKGRRVWNHSV
jgi:hypothetical protein